MIGRLRILALTALVGLSTTSAMADSAFGCSGLETDADLATLEGHDGVFFRMVSDLRMDRPFSQATVANLAELSRALAERGTTLVFAPVPTKAVTMPDWLPERARLMGFDLTVATEVQRDILRQLDAAGVITVDLRAAMVQGGAGRHTFFGTDTHWNAFGAELGAMAVAEVLKAQPIYDSLTKTTHETVEMGEKTAFSGMRRILQRRCIETLPEPVTMTYETRVASTGAAMAGGTLDIGLNDETLLDIGLEDEPLDIGLDDTLLDIGLDDTALDIGLGADAGVARDPASQLPVALVGTSFTDLAVSNFPGFVAQHAGVEVVNYAITGGGQYGAITSYLTSDDFQTAPPAFLVWENPIYANLAQNGSGPMRELIAAVRGCAQPVDITIGDDRARLTATLPPDLGPDHTLFLDTGTGAMAKATFRFANAAGRNRTKTIERGERLRLNGRFYMPLTGLWPGGAQSVEIDLPLPLGQAATLSVCAPEPSLQKD
ncbi:alginate O-acetyltransferase AlgX-related protein [Oceaniglobus ichthyenteri]|uniref:alginate O-acetyltransferase AlgX-related protein n=1 Tax=Oceaniglobus ichthyenteri TaxID=2136177 RepID=UPI000D36C677|nr:hypothetical protein [Oceaniglobus ichthyenteri]